MVPAEREEDTTASRTCVVAGAVVLEQYLASLSDQIKEETLPGICRGCYWIALNHWRRGCWRRTGDGRSAGSRGGGSQTSRGGTCGWGSTRTRTDCCSWKARTIACTVKWTGRQWVIRIAVAVCPDFSTQGGHIVLQFRKIVNGSEDDIDTPTSKTKGRMRSIWLKVEDCNK